MPPTTTPNFALQIPSVGDRDYPTTLQTTITRIDSELETIVGQMQTLAATIGSGTGGGTGGGGGQPVGTPTEGVTFSNSTFRSIRALQPNSWYGYGSYTASPSNNRSGEWGVSKMIQSGSTVKSKGIAQVSGPYFLKSGLGDMTCEYIYQNYRCGDQNGDDESISGKSHHIEDSGPEFTAVVGSSVYNNKGIVPSSSNSADHLGMGRYLILLKKQDGTDAAISSGNITSVSSPTSVPTVDQPFGTITTDTSHALTACWGRATANIVTPLNADQEQQVTFTVQIKGGTLGHFTTGSVIAISGWRRVEQARVISVTQAVDGQQTITAMLRETYEDDPYFPFIFQGGPVGTGFTIKSYQKGDGSPGTQRFFVPIIGALTANTYVYAMQAAAGQASPGFVGWSLFDGVGGQAFSVYSYAEVIACTDEAGTYNTGTPDHTAQYGLYIGLEANDTNWISGSTVEQPPYHSVRVVMRYHNFACNTGGASGYVSGWSGTCMTNGFTAIDMYNHQPESFYTIGNGKTGPAFTVLRGIWGSILNLGDNPGGGGCILPGSTCFYIGAPLFDRNQASYTLFKFDTKTCDPTIDIDVPNDAIVTTINGTNQIQGISPTGYWVGTDKTQKNFTVSLQGAVTAKSLALPNDTTPANSTTTEPAGKMWFDDNYMYRVTSNGTIKRIALTTF